MNFFPARGGYSWVVTVDFFLCSLVRKRVITTVRFWNFALHFCYQPLFCSLVFCLPIACFSFLSAIVYFHSIQSFSGGTPFVNYHVSASAGGALVSLEYLIHLLLYVRLLYILFFSVYYWTISTRLIVSFCCLSCLEHGSYHLMRPIFQLYLYFRRDI